MKKTLIILFSLLAFTAAHAEIHWGIRGGYNITKMSFSNSVLSSSNQKGFYVGPTVKVGLALGFGLDLSAIYDQREASSDLYVTPLDGTYIYNDQFPALKRKTLSLPLNLRYHFGVSDVFNVFVFVGPQFDFSLNSDIQRTDVKWSWNSSTYSANIGAGITLAEHFELRVNYNIPCSESGKFNITDAYNKASDGINGKTGAWQIGAAIYF